MSAKDLNDHAREGELPRTLGDASRLETGKVALRAVSDDDEGDLALPSDVHTEATLLGVLLWSGTYAEGKLHVGLVTDLVEQEAFFTPAHRAIFGVLVARHAEHQRSDGASVKADLLAKNLARGAGGVEYVDELTFSAIPSSEPQIRGYAQAIRNMWLRRRAVAVGEAIVRNAKACKLEPLAVLDKARKDIDATTAAAGARVQITTAAHEIEKMMHAQGAGASGSKLKTGVAGFDHFMHGGLPDNEVTILAARTSVGKSAFAAQLAKGIVDIEPAAGVLYISLEMTGSQLVQRWAAGIARVDSRHVEEGRMTPDESARYAAAADAIFKLPILFSARRSQTCTMVLQTIAGAVTMLAADGKRLRAVAIDHIHLVKPERNDGDRLDFVRRVSRMLPYIVETYGCGVLALAQVARAAETQGKDTTPRLHHLKESSSLEDDADNVVFIHRKRDRAGGFVDNTAKIIFAKQRSRATGSFELEVEPRFCIFYEPLQVHLEAQSREYVDGYGERP